MKKLFTLVALIAGLASGQTYNVAITNSLLGPVDLTIDPTVSNTVSISFPNATLITNVYNTYNSTGLNVVTPQTVSTNVSGTWTIQLTTNYPVGMYTQTGNITNIAFSVGSTNDVALGLILFRASTNSITWPTNNLTWLDSSAPTLATGVWSQIYIQAWRGDHHAKYIGDSL